MINQPVDSRPVLANVWVSGVFIFDTPDGLERVRREFELAQLPDSPDAPKGLLFGREKVVTR